MKITALAPWYGSNRMCAEHVGKALAGCDWVGVPFAGGMCELGHITASTLLVSDLHAHVLNLAAVAADEISNPALRFILDGLPHHPDVLAKAQRQCIDREIAVDGNWFGGKPEVGPAAELDWAVGYFVSVWWARNGTAGTKKEFEAPLSVRWKPGGGDSCIRVRTATDALEEWLTILRRCTFVRMDVFAFLDRLGDMVEGQGLYLDPPFPGPGDDYKYTFSIDDHRNLARWLGEMKSGVIVCRFYDHPLIRELYPESRWTWDFLEGGKRQTNEDAPEVLLTRGGV